MRRRSLRPESTPNFLCRSCASALDCSGDGPDAMSTGGTALNASWRGEARVRPVLAGCAAILLIAALASLAVGPVVIAPDKVISILWDGLFGARGSSPAELRDTVVVLDIRLPRMVLSAIVGAHSRSQARSCRVYSATRSPIPALSGFHPARASGGCVDRFRRRGNRLRAPVYRQSRAPVRILCRELIAILLLHRLSSHEGRTSVANLLFAGIALGSLASAASA